MDRAAESYVKLVLAVGQHDPDYVDAFYGPPEWKVQAEAAKRPLADLRAEAERLVADVQAMPATGDEMERLRHQYLTRQLQAMVARLDMLSGKKLSFDEESQALYDSVAPTYGADHFQSILDRLERLVPGDPADTPLPARIDLYRQNFVIPRDKLDTVFQAAISECKRRTLEHFELPPGESFEVEYVTDKSWSGYNWYKGGFHSLIQVNTDLPIFIERAIDLACHEGYPGHHVYNALLEKHLVRDRGWPEFSVYALFSPQSLIAEGTANYGIEVAFPGDERVRFEREKLFPLAGIDPSTAERYYEIQRLTQQLAYAGNEAARGYLNGTMTKQQAIDWQVHYNLSAPARAEQRIKFFDQYRSYVINYNYGQDLVKQYIERRGGTADNPAKRWEEFEKLLASPRLPSGLR
ncbi:MAG: hypothetical protein QOH06_102 [Acidobacteriota bacterium]|jgi:hypothetical protein|nr:hypothetical protein [Acidobacteriota bacterium]